MSGRKLNVHEQKLHQAALADPKKTITQKECDVLVTDVVARTAAINFLLGTGLLKAMKDTKGALSFRAVMKKELEVKKDMSGEEAMILSHIQGAKDEGIWTKHIKAKTELHQTVIDRCLKSLVQKQLIKAVKSVKHPTRKIYMLYHLDPSVEMTGGPWYTDNELDTEFIKLLCSACLRFVRDRSTPKQKTADAASADELLFPISAAAAYPTAQQILTFLSKSRITETQLTVEHVEMLLNVLVLDGDIERVPAFGAAMWDTADHAGNASDSDDSDDDSSARAKAKARAKEKKRKRKDDSPERAKKRSKRSRSSSGSDEDDSEDDSDSEDERARERRRKRKKSKSRAASSDEESEDERERRKRKKRRAGDDADEDADVVMSDAERKSKSKGKSKSKSKSKGKGKKRRRDSDSDTDSDSSDDSDDDHRSRSRSKSKSKSRKRSASPVDVTAAFLGEEHGAYVYRAVRQERIGGGGGGLAQTPCVRCPTFDFCSESGPVNPKECTYYVGWLAAADVAMG